MSVAGAARLVIVYNADAGLLASVIDSVHKLISPSTYPCSLCAVTYGPLAMDRRWRAYLTALPMAVTFHHRPDFHAAYRAWSAAALPLIARDDDGVLTPLLDAAALARLDTVPVLIAALEDALSRTGNAQATCH